MADGDRWSYWAVPSPWADGDSLQAVVVTDLGAQPVCSVLVWRCCRALGPTAEHVGGPLNAMR